MKRIPIELSDDQAERIGRIIAESFGLRFADESTLTRPVYETNEGTFSNKGIARRTLRFICEGIGFEYRIGFFGRPRNSQGKFERLDTVVRAEDRESAIKELSKTYEYNAICSIESI